MVNSEINSSAYIEAHTLAGKHLNTVNTLSFSPDSTYLASGGDDCTVIVWHVARGDELYRLVYEKPVSCIIWHPVHPDTILVGCDDGRIFQMFDFTLASVDQRDIKLGVVGQVNCLAYSPRTSFLAAGVGYQVHVTREQKRIDVYLGDVVLPKPSDRSDVYDGDRTLAPMSLHFTNVGDQLIVSYLAHGIICYEIDSRNVMWRILPQNLTPNIGSSALSEDGKYIVAHNIENGVDLYVANGRKNRPATHYTFDKVPNSRHRLQVNFVQRGGGIVCGTTTGSVCIWYKGSTEIFQKLHHDSNARPWFITGERGALSYIATGSVAQGQEVQIKIWRAVMSRILRYPLAATQVDILSDDGSDAEAATFVDELVDLVMVRRLILYHHLG
ncbi:WD40-repeat-containing domain protein [Earliella scabrosa]|nr:WD40-repeat-containing domain protein [Earliella scabrosa]